MGMIVSVYKPADGTDCTNRGLSSYNYDLCVVNVEGPFEPSKTAPAVKLVKGPFDTARLVPVGLIENNIQPIFGGNYGATSDSRFRKAVEAMTGAFIDIVKIFDRVE